MIGINASEWEGLDGMGEEELRALKPKAMSLMIAGGVRFQAELKTKLSGARSGRTYKVSKTGKLHTASAPGEPPAVLTGALRNSMGYEKPKWEGWILNMDVGSGLGVKSSGEDPDAYARRLEFGGMSFHPWPIDIKARPYMAPTAEKMEPILQKLFEDGL